jgi:hypothetical protein
MVPNTEVVDTELELLQETLGIRKKGLQLPTMDVPPYR